MRETISRFVWAVMTLALLCLWTGCQSTPAPAPTAATSPAPPPHVKTPPQAVNCPNNPDHTPGAKAQYEQVACSTVPACPAATDDESTQAFNVDEYLKDDANDTPICLRVGKDDQAMLYSPKGSKIKLMGFQSKDPGGTLQPGHPFSHPGTKWGDGSKSFLLWTGKDLRSGSAAQPGQCYKFKGLIWVKPKGGPAACYDPHIYGDCADACF